MPVGVPCVGLRAEPTAGHPHPQQQQQPVAMRIDDVRYGRRGRTSAAAQDASRSKSPGCSPAASTAAAGSRQTGRAFGADMEELPDGACISPKRVVKVRQYAVACQEDEDAVAEAEVGVGIEKIMMLTFGLTLWTPY